MSATEAPVLAEVRNRVGHLSLNRPAGLNALTLPMVRLLLQQLHAWERDPEILAVVLRANGEKAFCAGGDIRMLYDSHRSGGNLHEIFLEEEYALDAYIHAYPKPTLALMDGFVLGGGMGLVQGASLRVISERTRMAMPEVAIGFFPDVGGSYFLPRLPGELGIFLGVTGMQVRAADALYCRLADWCLPSERLAEFDRGLDDLHWTGQPREALRNLVASLATDQLPGAELKTVRAAIDQHFALADLQSIRTALAQETRAELRAWCDEVIRVLDSRSPLAMAVTLELLRRGRQLPLADCFAQELHLDYQWFDQGDLIEGIRALIVDKDKTPRWRTARIEALDAQQVQQFFSGFKPAPRANQRTA
ncbi:enoyl-CoA hydratase/isomerase family protein [Pseudomonas lalucatii]|uniref:3-hydroxyisobutyryl-CoA hydrolase n=1 Tax=Pseudomonas lalucatii TaxID=1424203 RepID=A0ABS5PXK9_9PSED|nr:enoyl-CoA hydratase/isomerase family protein [Pseudomonas lalucatii]MBS7660599.1 enoyl-CoA hydratase/isomerase family protein [Pseudomonas lalucatii]